MPTWEDHDLPTFNAGLQESIEPAFVRSPTEMGAPIQVRRYSATPHYFAGQMTFTQAQRAAFDAFFNREIGEGADTFTMEDPSTGQNATFRFVSPPSFTLVQGANGPVHIGALSLERLP